MAKITLKERQRQAREDAILEAAQDLVIEQGYADMSMDELAARVGASKATLYQHFASKEELVIKVIARRMRRAEELLAEQDALLPAIRRLEQALRCGLSERTNFASAGVHILPHHLKQHRDYQEPLQRLYAAQIALIEQAKAEGDVALHLSTPMVVRMLQGLYRIDYEDLLRTGECTQAEMIDTLIEVALNGIRNHAKEKDNRSTTS